jgi:uncharacterized protein (TIGR04255 family)
MDPHGNIKYHKPPIIEVVAEFRFVPSEPWDLTVPGLVYDLLREQFPGKRLLKVLEGEAAAGVSGIHQEFRLSDRMQFLRKDEKAFIQVGPDLVAINHLAPYPTWEGFMPLVRNAFDAYRKVAHPRGVRRIGLLYLNQIAIPGSFHELGDYLDFRPHVGPRLPWSIGRFLVVAESSYDQDRDILRLRLTSGDESIATGTLVARLDLDYFTAQPETVPLDSALDWIERAHSRVQEAFESCVTDRLRALFEF